jgi:16S rRNA (uracil1498-N3)-methyltransferase
MPRSHASLRRLYVGDPLAQGGELTLDRAASNYLVAVLRLGPDAEFVVFNGRDGAWLARLSAPSKTAARAVLIEQIAPQTPPSELWYGFAPLKSERLDWMVQRATEMGCGFLQPVITQFTQQTRPRLDKIAANVVEAAEQCEVLSVPQVLDPIALPALLAGWREAHGERALIFADEATDSASPLPALDALRDRPVGLLVGPEGGFSDAERENLKTHDFVVPISLGPRILRADTAAIAALATIQAFIGDWR